MIDIDSIVSIGSSISLADENGTAISSSNPLPVEIPASGALTTKLTDTTGTNVANVDSNSNQVVTVEDSTGTEVDFATQTTLSNVNDKIPTKGTATIANSLPVNVASDQIVNSNIVNSGGTNTANVNSDNQLETLTEVSNDHLTDIIEGKISGHSIMRAMGEREGMGATVAIRSSGEDVWRGNDGTIGGGTFIPLPSVTGEQMEVVSSDPEDMPSGVLTFTGNALNGETVTIGTKTYTFQTTLTNVDGNVLIGATVTDTIYNLTTALYPEPNDGKGTLYAAAMTMQPEDVLCTNVPDQNKVVFSTSTGSLASTETLTNASFTSGTLTAKDGTAVVEIEYLDSDGYEQEEYVILNGTTAVSTTFTDGIFVNDFYARLVSEAGTGEGNITVRKQGGTGADTYNMLGIGQNKSLVPKRMIPKGKTLALRGWDNSEVRGKRNIYRIRCTASHGVRVRHVYHFIDNNYVRSAQSGQLELNEKVPELSIVTVSAWADQDDAMGSCSWWGILTDN